MLRKTPDSLGMVDFHRFRAVLGKLQVDFNAVRTSQSLHAVAGNNSPVCDDSHGRCFTAAITQMLHIKTTTREIIEAEGLMDKTQNLNLARAERRFE